MYQKDKLPEVEVRTPNIPMTQERQDLWDAAQLIRKGGLCKYCEETPNGEYCWVGALKKVTMGLTGSTQVGERMTSAVEQFNRANGMYKYHGREYAYAWIYWNNLPETTAEDVIAKLEYAALS